MPKHAKTHKDMLKCCCGICGLQKKSNQLRKITNLILERIKTIDGYKDYDINDDRYPKVISKEHDIAVRERCNNNNNLTYKFTKKLPSVIPQFKNIPLPHASTRTTPIGYSSTHTCFLCDQNKVGRPRSHTENESKDTGKFCSKCFQETGRGIAHPCTKYKIKSMKTISSTILNMEPKVQDKIVHKIIKSNHENNIPLKSHQKISIHTAGNTATVHLNPSTSGQKSVKLKTKTLDEIRIQAGLTLNQSKIVTGGIRSDLGRKCIPTNYRNHASSLSKSLDNFYVCEKHEFIVSTKSGEPSKYMAMWSVYAPIVPLIEWVNIKRENVNPEDYMIKIMCDSGQGKLKICMCIIPINSDINLTKKTRSLYIEGGILAKGYQYSGINKCIMCFCAPGIKEHHWNMRKIFNLIKIHDVFTKFQNVILTGDLKLLNEIYGLMESSSKHPCLYCTAESQQIVMGEPRTIGSLKKDYQKWSSSSGANKKRCKEYNNVKNPPLLQNIPDEVPVLKITPPPMLHILLGVFNHIWKNMENISELHKQVLHDFAIRHNCIKESYWGKTFEGNECTKLMNNIAADDKLFYNLPNIKTHITALKIFNNLRIQMFGMTLHHGWKNTLAEFEQSYKKIPNISKPPKIHILLCHCCQFLKLYGQNKGLGFYSEQTGETVHSKFESIFSKYKIKNIHSEKYGNRLRKAVVDFSSIHV